MGRLASKLANKLANTADIHMISVGQGAAQRSYRVLSLALLQASIDGTVEKAVA